ncbi:MAG: glycine cleavage system protein H [Bacteroidales bacterium]|nr:glycine cleavage system protein H [Bacteroidales bacterium]
MENFTYTNIFDTKGIEYLIILAFFALLIPFWIILNKQPKIVKQIRKTWDVLTANILRIPQGLFFNKNHTWAYLEKSGNAKVGLDDLLLQIVGQMKISNLKNAGEMIKKGDLLTEIDQNGKSLRIYSPISGEIMSSNSIISEDPGILNEDPYEKGWIYNIKPSNWVSETKSCYLADEASGWLRRELDRFKDFLAISFSKYSSEPSMIVFQEGGELRSNPLSELQDEIWVDFQKEFLNQ